MLLGISGCQKLNEQIFFDVAPQPGMGNIIAQAYRRVKYCVFRAHGDFDLEIIMKTRIKAI